MGRISDHTKKDDAHHRDCGSDDDEIAFTHGFPHKKSTQSRSRYGAIFSAPAFSENEKVASH
jgi:hypothetical protein